MYIGLGISAFRVDDTERFREVYLIGGVGVVGGGDVCCAQSASHSYCGPSRFRFQSINWRQSTGFKSSHDEIY